MAIVLQPERWDWNQNDVQISKIKLNLVRIIDGGCFAL